MNYSYSQANKRTIFKYLAGSHAYGTSRPDSDIDYRGVFIPPVTVLLEPGDKIKEVVKKGEDDKLYTLHRVFDLMLSSNPAFLEFLFVPPDCVVSTSRLWGDIVFNRDWFLSQRIKKSFSGYAIAQLKRIRLHRGYLLDPPDHKPTRQEFELPEKSTVPKEQRSAVLSISAAFLRDEVRKLVKKEMAYTKAKVEWDSYQKWECGRNPARKALEAKFGYDTKHASHLVRLVRMGIELLETGDVEVRRPDAEELKAIRDGAWSYEKLEDYASKIDAMMDPVLAGTPLPEEPDRESALALFWQTLERFYDIDLRGLYQNEGSNEEA